MYELIEKYLKRSLGALELITVVFQFFKLLDHDFGVRRALLDFESQLLGLVNHAAFAGKFRDQHAPLVANQLRGTSVKPGAAIGFPLGCTTMETKVFETKDAIKNGAKEVDMVMNVGALKSGDLIFVEKDIAAVVAAAKGKALVKIILETCLLTDDEIVTACKLAQKARADFVKTSTGFNSAGATVAHVALMRKTVGKTMGVKASGGIRTYYDAVKMIEAGATKIGTSAGVQIVKEQEKIFNSLSTKI